MITAGLAVAMPVMAAPTVRQVTVFDGTPGDGAGDSAAGQPPGVGAGAVGDLRKAMVQAGSGDTINFACPTESCTITLRGPLPPISADLTIDGGGKIVIEGASTWRAFFVDSGTVEIKNLTVRNVRAKGGNGGAGGGGGGAGLGAGVFIRKNTAIVTLTNVAFVGTAAQGGNGAAGGSSARGGGGGGLSGNGGNGGVGGGGGGGGVLTNGTSAIFDAGIGGNGGGGGGGSNPNGGSGGNAYILGDPAGGTAAGVVAGGGSFGGGGGGTIGNAAGAAGGIGGGGGAGGTGGGAGGLGGGGGGGLLTTSVGGAGGSLGMIGGGTGGNAGYGGGGGGAAAGPAVFVYQGTLTTVNSTSVTATATAGDGGTSTQGGTAGENGTANATAVFNYGGTVNGSMATGPVPDALPAPAYGLTVAVTGPGTVTSSTGGISCPGTCVASFAAGTNLTLTATAAASATFTGWTGDCILEGDRRQADLRRFDRRQGDQAPVTTPTLAVSMYGARSCTATFVSTVIPTPTPAPPAPAPAFVATPAPPVLNATTVGTGSGSFSLSSSFSDPASLTFTATQNGAPLPGWLTFTPSTVSFSYNVPVPSNLPFQPVTGADGRAGRAEGGASWANTIYPLLLRVARIPVTLTAAGGGQSYTSTIQMDFYAPRPPVAISAVSLSLDGVVGNGRSGRSALSWDGGQMVFETGATNLFPASPNAQADIVRYQALSGDRDRLSQTAIPGGGVANAADGASMSPAVSADGSHAAFASDAPGITLIPTGRVRQVYRTALGYPRVPLNQQATPAPDLVSATAAGLAGNGVSDNPDLSQDGRYVVFESSATNFAPGLDGSRRVWRKDMQTGTLDAVSNGPGSNPSISWDGRHVAFERDGRIYLRDMAATAIVPVATGTRPQLTARADRIAFVATIDGMAQVMIVDIAGGTMRAVTAGNGPSDQPDISADGRFVAFRSLATNLVTGQAGNGQAQIFVRDVERGVTALVSQAATGAPAAGASWGPALSGDGGTLSFGSDARDLVNGNPAAGQAYLAANPLPLPARTGYWYMAGTGNGQGWVMERWGARAYVGGLAYDMQGRARWLAGSCTLAGLTCGGTLTGGTAFSLATAAGGSSATLTLGGAAGQVLTPFPIGGIRATGYAGLPQAGWWYEPAAGNNVGYFLDIDSQPQADGSVAQIGYLAVLGYDATGAQVWQSSQATLAADLSFSGMLMQYAGGAPFGATAASMPASGTAIGPVRLTFDGTDRARITLPGGRTADLARFRF